MATQTHKSHKIKPNAGIEAKGTPGSDSMQTPNKFRAKVTSFDTMGHLFDYHIKAHLLKGIAIHDSLIN